MVKTWVEENTQIFPIILFLSHKSNIPFKRSIFIAKQKQRKTEYHSTVPDLNIDISTFPDYKLSLAGKPIHVLFNSQNSYPNISSFTNLNPYPKTFFSQKLSSFLFFILDCYICKLEVWGGENNEIIQSF